MAMKIAEAFVRLFIRDDAMRKDMAGIRQRTQAEVGQLQQVIASMGAGLLGGATLGFGVKLAQEMEQAEIAFNVVIKDLETTKKLITDLNKFSDVTPFEPGEIRLVGQMLVQTGMAIEDILPNIRMLGDLAAGAGGDINEITRAFIKMRSEGKLQGEVEEIFQTQRVPLRALAEQAGITGEKWVEMRKKGELTFDLISKLLADATKDGGMFFGAMEQQSRSAAGLYSTLIGKVKALATAMGQQLLPAWKALLSLGISLVVSLQQLNEATQGFVVQTGAATAALVALRAAMIAARIAGISLVRSVLTATGVGLFVVALGAAIGGIAQLIQWIAKLAPVQEAWEQATEKVQMAWIRLREAFDVVFGAVMRGVNMLGNFLEQTFGISFGKMEEDVGGFVAQVINFISEMILDAAEWANVLVTRFDLVWEAIKQGARVGIFFMRDLFAHIPEFWAYQWGRTLRFLVDFASGAVRIVGTALAKLGELLVNIVRSAWDAAKAFLSGKDWRSIFAQAVGAAAMEARRMGEAFMAGWEKKGVGEVFRPSERLKEETARFQEIMGELAREKDRLEAERGELLEEEAEPTPEEKAVVKKEVEAVAQVEIPRGMLAFEDLSKKMQEATLKAANPQKDMARSMKASEIIQREQLVQLKEINAKEEPEPAPVAE
jgi:tape measure domain-containing protein